LLPLHELWINEWLQLTALLKVKINSLDESQGHGSDAMALAFSQLQIDNWRAEHPPES
jgi:hypothetical protein